MLKEEYNIMYVSEYPNNRYEFALSFVKVGVKVYDIGYGGKVLYSLKDRYKKFYGFELSNFRLEIARKQCKDMDIKLYKNAFEAYNFIDTDLINVYTVIYLDVIEHVVDVRKFLKNIFKILKHNGELILSLPNIARIDNRIKLLFGIFPSTSTGNQSCIKLNNLNLFDGGKLHYFTFSSMINLLKEADFKNIDKYGIAKYRKLHNMYPELLSASIALIYMKE